jgi:hypothetical protein
MTRKSTQWMGSILVSMALLASPALAQGSDCGRSGQKGGAPCSAVLCGRGQRLQGGRCAARPVGASAAKVATSDPTWQSPHYTLVCISANRLGDCDQHFSLAADDSMAQATSLWLRYASYTGVCPTGGSSEQPSAPLYTDVCLAKKDPNDPSQGWPCYSWLQVLATKESVSTTDGKTLYLLYQAYYGKCP